MVGLTFLGMLVTLLNGWRQVKAHSQTTNPAIMAIDKKADQTQMDVKYIREALDMQMSNYSATNQRIDGIVGDISMLNASVTTLQETMKIMQKTIEMQQNMILKMQGRDS